jgi:hypothetical protein
MSLHTLFSQRREKQSLGPVQRAPKPPLPSLGPTQPASRAPFVLVVEKYTHAIAVDPLKIVPHAPFADVQHGATQRSYTLS